jgi:hypothetical protein
VVATQHRVEILNLAATHSLAVDLPRLGHFWLTGRTPRPCIAERLTMWIAS